LIFSTTQHHNDFFLYFHLVVCLLLFDRACKNYKVIQACQFSPHLAYSLKHLKYYFALATSLTQMKSTPKPIIHVQVPSNINPNLQSTITATTRLRHHPIPPLSTKMSGIQVNFGWS
jgi:hypothetical protein